MEKNEYKCAMCEHIYEKGWTDEEARTEAEEIFGGKVDEWNGGAAVICDDCFMKIHPLKIENTDKLLKARAEANLH